MYESARTRYLQTAQTSGLALSMSEIPALLGWRHDEIQRNPWQVHAIMRKCRISRSEPSSTRHRTSRTSCISMTLGTSAICELYGPASVVSNPPSSINGAALGEGVAHATVGWVPARPSPIPRLSPGEDGEEEPLLLLLLLLLGGVICQLETRELVQTNEVKSKRRQPTCPLISNVIVVKVQVAERRAMPEHRRQPHLRCRCRQGSGGRATGTLQHPL